MFFLQRDKKKSKFYLNLLLLLLFLFCCCFGALLVDLHCFLVKITSFGEGRETRYLELLSGGLDGKRPLVLHAECSLLLRDDRVDGHPLASFVEAGPLLNLD